MGEKYTLPKSFITTVVGSYPKIPPADTLIRKRKKGEITEDEFHKQIRVSIKEVINDYIYAGVDILSDGEQSREDMVAYFAERIKGFHEGDWVRIFDNVYFRKPIVEAKLEYIQPMILDDWIYATSISGGRPVKAIITGPYTMVDWSFNKYYIRREDLIFDIAKVIRREIEEVVRRGAKFVQVDEPALSTRPLREEVELAREALKIVFQGINARKIVHICFGRVEKILPYILDFPVDQLDLEFKNSGFRLLKYLYEYGFDKELGYGVIDVHSTRIETKEEIKRDIERLLKLDILDPKKIYIDPDCGLKRLPREIAREKLRNMVAAAKELREEYE